jgi:hypothetical protein
VQDPTLAEQDEVAKRLLARAAELRERRAQEDADSCTSEALEEASVDHDAR